MTKGLNKDEENDSRCSLSLLPRPLRGWPDLFFTFAMPIVTIISAVNKRGSLIYRGLRFPKSDYWKSITNLGKIYWGRGVRRECKKVKFLSKFHFLREKPLVGIHNLSRKLA